MKLTDVELGVLRDGSSDGWAAVPASEITEVVNRLIETLDDVKGDNTRLREALQAVLEAELVDEVELVQLVRRALAASG